MEFKVLHKEFNYLSDASDERQDSLFFESGESVAELNILFLIDGNIHSIEFTLNAYGEVCIWDEKNKKFIDQRDIFFNIKDDKELYEKIYDNEDIEIINNNWFEPILKFDNKYVETPEVIFELKDLKEILNNDKKILDWYKYAIGEQQ